MTEVPHESAEAAEKPDILPEPRNDACTEANLVVAAQSPEVVALDDVSEDIGDAADALVSGPSANLKPESGESPRERLEPLAQAVGAKAVVHAPKETTPLRAAQASEEPREVEAKEKLPTVAEAESTEVESPKKPVLQQPPAEEIATSPQQIATNAEVPTTPKVTSSASAEDVQEEQQPQSESARPPVSSKPEEEPEPSASEKPLPETKEPEAPEVELLPPEVVQAQSEYEDILPWKGHDDEIVDPYLKKYTDEVKFTVDPEKIEQIEELCKELDFPFRSPTAVTCMYELAEQLQPHLAEYSRIVGDDTSGRLPALVYRKLINQARAKAGLPPAQTFFIAGSGEQLWREYFPELASPFEGRTLVVTEYTSSGRSPAEMYYSLASHTPEHEVDFAMIGAEEGAAEVVKESTEAGSRIFIGNEGSIVASLLYHPGRVEYKGVFKRAGDARAVRQPKEYYDGAAVARARQDAARIAEKFGELLATPAAKIPREGFGKGIFKLFKSRGRLG
jgi:hypothetical protein